LMAFPKILKLALWTSSREGTHLQLYE
jgi:hypothetical protein